MPLYEYECERGHRFERIVKYSDPPIDACPECGAAVHKLMSSPAIQFKGSGWYITDYARKGGETRDTKETKTSETKGTDGKETKETKETKSEKPSESAAKTTTAASSSSSTKSD